ncbi:3,4-dihydroxy-2-butanone-4-phosphate synthase [Bacillus shackletonii]|nr:3,4-dihydroxy-2-butanone-4-phosphate synthase [Heyndrickxia shackletonii]
MFNTIEEAIQDLKLGKVVIVCDDENRENEGDFIAIAEKASPEIINFMVTHGRGLVCVPIEKELAQKLELTPMVSKNTDSHETAFTVSIDHKFSTTGISAYERSATILHLIDENSIASDFNRPGHVFPLIAREGGVLQRQGHTEAAVDLARLCGAKPAGVICEIMNADGSMARVPQLSILAKKFGLKMITIKDLVHYQQTKQEYLI